MYEDYNNSPPVRVDEEIEVEITAVGEKGDGLTKKDGFVIFVPNTQVGDRVRVKITKLLSKVAFGEVVGQGEQSTPAEEDEPASEEQASEETPPKKESIGDGAAPAEEPVDSYDFGEEDTSK